MKHTKTIYFFAFIFFFMPFTTYAKERVHIITVPYSYGTDAIILESEGKFAMIDTGEDFDYPDGSDFKIGYYHK